MEIVEEVNKLTSRVITPGRHPRLIMISGDPRKASHRFDSTSQFSESAREKSADEYVCCTAG